MEKEPARWRRPGVFLAVAALVVVAIYFLVIFVKQSLIFYAVTREIRDQERPVTRLTLEIEALRKELEGYANPLFWAKKSLAYKEPGEKIAIPVEGSPRSKPGRPETEKTATFREELAALPTWQKWLWIIFVGAEH